MGSCWRGMRCTSEFSRGTSNGLPHGRSGGRRLRPQLLGPPARQPDLQLFPAPRGRDGLRRAHDRAGFADERGAADPHCPRHRHAGHRPVDGVRLAADRRHPDFRRGGVDLQLLPPVVHGAHGGRRGAGAAQGRVRRRHGARHVLLRRISHRQDRQPRHLGHAGLRQRGDADPQPDQPGAAGGDHLWRALLDRRPPGD